MSDTATWRFDVIEAVALRARDLVLTPAPEATSGREAMARECSSLQVVFRGYEAAVKRDNRSSSESYAFRDLPAGEKAHYESAKHAIAVLDTLYLEPLRPQSGEQQA